MRKIIRFYDGGFTIIELLIAIIILGVVMAAITTMIVQSFNVFDSSTRRMSATQLAELGLSEVGQYLRSTTDILENSLLEENDNYQNSPWKFEAYHFNNEDELSEFEFELNNRSILLTVRDSEDNNIYERNILNNVEDFYIKKLEDDVFEIMLEVRDGDGNIARKRLNVNSRNL